MRSAQPIARMLKKLKEDYRQSIKTASAEQLNVMIARIDMLEWVLDKKV